MRDFQISVIGSGIRTDKWMRLYKSLAFTDVSFEIVFAGNVVPDFSLPENFRFFKTHVKPAQCVEIAARNASSEIVMAIADDMVFSKFFLDKMLSEYYKRVSLYDYIYSNFEREGALLPTESKKFWPGIEGSPIMPMCITLATKAWNAIGGVDKNFIALFWDLDMALRLREHGGSALYCDSAIAREILEYEEESRVRRLIEKISRKKTSKTSLFEEVGVDADRPMLDSFWTEDLKSNVTLNDYYAFTDGKGHCRKRKAMVQPFRNHDLECKSQGPAGRW